MSRSSPPRFRGAAVSAGSGPVSTSGRAPPRGRPGRAARPGGGRGAADDPAQEGGETRRHRLAMNQREQRLEPDLGDDVAAGAQIGPPAQAPKSRRGAPWRVTTSSQSSGRATGWRPACGRPADRAGPPDRGWGLEPFRARGRRPVASARQAATAASSESASSSTTVSSAPPYTLWRWQGPAQDPPVEHLPTHHPVAQPSPSMHPQARARPPGADAPPPAPASRRARRTCRPGDRALPAAPGQRDTRPSRSPPAAPTAAAPGSG